MPYTLHGLFYSAIRGKSRKPLFFISNTDTHKSFWTSVLDHHLSYLSSREHIYMQMSKDADLGNKGQYLDFADCMQQDILLLKSPNSLLG